MSSYILIGSLILLSILITHLLLKKYNILTPFTKESSHMSLFLSNEEALKVISQKASLNEEEKENLELLFTMISGNRLHQGFEDKEITDKWLISARRAITNNNELDKAKKEELEYSVYEIHRKINNVRMMTHPRVKYISDLDMGQKLTVIFTNGKQVPAIITDYNFSSFSICINLKDSTNIPKKLDKKKIQVTLWKILDAQYSFVTQINAVEKNSKEIVLLCSHPKKIVCTKIRFYTRQETEIPVKFRQESVTIDPDTGGLIQSFGGLFFGIVGNLSPWGCSLISYIPIPEHTVLQIEIPMFNHILEFKGTIKHLSQEEDVCIFNIEFQADTPRENTLTLYRYLFAEDSSRSI